MACGGQQLLSDARAAEKNRRACSFGGGLAPNDVLIHLGGAQPGVGRRSGADDLRRPFRLANLREDEVDRVWAGTPSDDAAWSRFGVREPNPILDFVGQSPTGSRFSIALRAALAPVLPQYGIMPDDPVSHAQLASPGFLGTLMDVAYAVLKTHVGGDLPNERPRPASERTGSASSKGSSASTPDPSSTTSSIDDWPGLLRRTPSKAKGSEGPVFWAAAPCETDILPTRVGCTSSEDQDICEAVRFLEDHWADVPNFVDAGVRYETALEAIAPFLTVQCAHSAADHPLGETPSGYGQVWGALPDIVFANPPLFEEAMSSLILGPDEFRAGVLLHEMVHSLEYQLEDLGGADWSGGGERDASSGFDDLFWNPDSFCGISGSCRTPDGDDERTEWRAAYVQARFYGIETCGANAFACSYYRTFCTNVSSDEGMALTVAEIASCYLGGSTVLAISVVLGLLLVAGLAITGHWVEAIGAALGSSAAVILLALLYIVLIDETSLG